MKQNRNITKEYSDEEDISSFAFLKGFAIGNRYEIIDKLGSGGMGLVYKATDKSLNETVVLKILLQQLSTDDKFLERFKREVLLTRKITHPNVIRVHDIGEIGNILYISMEYFGGIDLDTKLRRIGALPLMEAIHIIKQICTGLSAAHRLGIIHRDVKPKNVLLDEKNFVKIIDFGLARSPDLAGLTMKDEFIGTPFYMSPEQIITPDKVDYRTDIYSLGVLMYEMFTGQLPFESDTPVSAAFKHVKEKPPLPKSVNPNVPEWVENVILKALEKDPNKRFQSTAEIVSIFDTGILEPNKISFDKSKYGLLEIPPVMLSITKRKLVERIYIFTKPLVTLGRHKEADLMLRIFPRNERNDHRSLLLGKIHAYIRSDGENFVLKDLDSKNCTFVKGIELKPNGEVVLEDETVISLAGVLDLHFKIFRDAKKKVNCAVLRRIHNLPEEKYILVHKEITIGSDAMNAIVLNGERIAGQHARIFIEGDMYWIENLVDTPKIYCENVRLGKNQFQPLKPSTAIRIGDVELSFDMVS